MPAECPASSCTRSPYTYISIRVIAGSDNTIRRKFAGVEKREQITPEVSRVVISPLYGHRGQLPFILHEAHLVEAKGSVQGQWPLRRRENRRRAYYK